MSTNGFNIHSLHVIGHSLGGQLAGSLGRAIQKKGNVKLTRITGLDVAKPFFYPGLRHINKDDAKMVDIIHTDAGVYGANIPTGTVDFWPNRGKRLQPGCPKFTILLSQRDFCSHKLSWRFYVESVLFRSSLFLSTQCGSWREYESGKCDGNTQIHMGINAAPFTGNFYLRTDSIAPFSRAA
jgi:hypothetical protein